MNILRRIKKTVRNIKKTVRANKKKNIRKIRERIRKKTKPYEQMRKAYAQFRQPYETYENMCKHRAHKIVQTHNENRAKKHMNMCKNRAQAFASLVGATHDDSDLGFAAATGALLVTAGDWIDRLKEQIPTRILQVAP